jgi:hypothetical protein
MRKLLLSLAVLALMIVSGSGAVLASLSFLMSLGTRNHGNYEYYGQTPAVALIFVAGALGFAAPAVIVWYLHKSSWRLSLRTLLIATTMIAVVLGLVVWASR